MRKSKIIFKKIIFSVLLISPLFLYLSVVSIIQISANPEKAPYVHWGGLDPHSEVYISWETLNEESSHIKYGITMTNLSLFFDNSTVVSIHHSKLTGLIPNTRYYYQVEDNEGNPLWNIHTFKTAPNPGNSFNITMISDTQQLLGIGHYEMVASAISKIIETDFVLDAGDIVQDNNQKSWDYFFKVSEKYTNKFPLITVPGNHDGDDIHNLYTTYFTQSNPNGRYYSFNWSNTQFVMAEIADGGDVPKGIPENDLHYEWLNQTLENGQDKDYRIIVFHRNVFSSIGNDEGIMANLIPVIEHYNVSLTIYGHKHAYDRYFYNNYTYLCLGGGSGLQNSYIETQEFSQFHAMGPSISILEFSPSLIRLKTVTPTFDVIEEVEFVQKAGYLVPHSIGGL
jgi:predicted phosphodiesterase